MEFKNNTSFAQSVLTKLEAMDDIELLEKDSDLTVIAKEQVQFGEVINQTLKLLDKDGKYYSVKKNILEDNDELLKMATTSYWIASGQK